MDNDRNRVVADGFDAPEILDPGIATSGFLASSLLTIPTNSISGPPELTLKSLIVDQHGAAADNNTVVPPIHNTTEMDARSREETALWLCELRNSETARPVKRTHELDSDAESHIPIQAPKRTRFPTLGAVGADFETRRQAASSSKSCHGFTPAPATHRPARTPLPSCRTIIELIPSVPDMIPECSQDSKFSQNFVTGGGWTAVNNGPQTLLRPEDDLTIKINTIIPAPHVCAGTHHGRHMSASPFTRASPPAYALETASQLSPLKAAAPSIERSPTLLLLGGGLTHDAANPFTSRVTSKASNAKKAGAKIRASKAEKANNVTIASGSSSPSNWARISSNARARNLEEPTDPSDSASTDTEDPAPAPAQPKPRKKWCGRSFASLALEALRSATAENHILTINQITAYVEKYRLTTDMTEPALRQTVRSAVMRNCKRIKKDGTRVNGLLLHVSDPGKRTGKYKLLPEGFAADAAVVE